MKNTITIIFILLSFNLLGQTKVLDLADCLKTHANDPKEYILNLFKTNDIVVIGERNHNDTTQYNLLLDVLGDKRFIENVGHVYTEVGCVNRTEYANKVLKATYKNDIEFENNLITLCRDLDFNPLWEKYSMYKYLKGIYAINKDLDEASKITVGLTDLAFEWEGMTRKKYAAFEAMMKAEYCTRDSIMADNFIKLYDKQIPIAGQRKALLIQSLSHAINLDLHKYNVNIRTVGSYLVERYKERLKIVALNSVFFGKYNSNYACLVDDGRWDAAFEMTSCKPIGFDIQNTPFANTKYEDANGAEVYYHELVDGLVYDVPFYDYKLVIGTPNIVDKDFSNELVRRVRVSNESFIERLGLSLLRFHFKEGIVNYYGNVRVLNDDNKETLEKQMNKWIAK
jgi:hypothetical protein